MAPTLKPIEPKTPRWTPSADPSTIVVPGLDTSASVNDQIEQIEQLITIKLQNVDANFSKIQQVMANRILPAVKRYAVGTEPVREAAKFWTTFFEQAAQIRVPTYEEEDVNLTQTEDESEAKSTVEESQAEDLEHDTTTPQQSFHADRAASEVSFMPNQAAMSTPATTRHQSHDNTFLSQDGQMPSWSASLESPLVRLDRDLQSLTQDEVSVASSSILHQDQQDQDSYYDESQDVTQRQIPNPIFEQPSRGNISHTTGDRGKGKATADSLRHSVLRRGVDASSHSIRNATMVSPLKVKGRTPHKIKSMNPYLSPGAKPSDWKGVVDLRDPSVATPRGKTPGKTRFAVPSSSKRTTTPPRDLDDDLDLTIGMSPPVTMAFAKLPAPAGAPKLGRTPRKQAAERIMKSLLDVERRLGAPTSAPTTESSMASVPTPPSLSRYNRSAYPPPEEMSSSLADASLESMMKRVGLTGFDYRASSAGRGDVSSVSSTAPSVPSGNAYTRSILVGSRDVSSVSSTTPSVPSGNAYARPSLNQAAYTSASAASQQRGRSPTPPKFDMRRLVDDELTDPNANDDSDSDSLDYDNDPDASADAFLGPPQDAHYANDDSFSSEGSSDSMDGGNGGAHPFAHDMGEDDGDAFDDEDSFDDRGGESTQEETLFGVPPAQRLARQAQSRMQGGQLRMLGQELLEDTIGIGAQVHGEETPTPWMR